MAAQFRIWFMARFALSNTNRQRSGLGLRLEAWPESFDFGWYTWHRHTSSDQHFELEPCGSWGSNRGLSKAEIQSFCFIIFFGSGSRMMILIQVCAESFRGRFGVSEAGPSRSDPTRGGGGQTKSTPPTHQPLPRSPTLKTALDRLRGTQCPFVAAKGPHTRQGPTAAQHAPPLVVVIHAVPRLGPVAAPPAGHHNPGVA